MEMIKNPAARVIERKIDSDLPEDKIKPIEAPTEVNLPDIHPAFLHMLELYYLSGQAQSTGMGLVSLSWQELEAFVRMNSLELTLFEIETLKKMSDEYCREYALATDPQRKAPYSIAVEPEQEDKIAKALMIREQLRAFGNRKQG